MNGVITLTDGFATIENRSITSDNITTSNIITDDINLNTGNGRSLSVIDDWNNKAYYSDILSLTGIIYNYENIYNSKKLTLSNTIYNNYNNTIATQNNTVMGFFLAWAFFSVGFILARGVKTLN